MDKKTKKKWVRALRSGDYKQGKRALRQAVCDDEGKEIPGKEEYCCLGVLCDIVEPNLWRFVDGEWRNSKWGGGLPRDALLKRFGLDKPLSPHDEFYYLARKLADMNDKGKSFKQIANWIEKHEF